MIDRVDPGVVRTDSGRTTYLPDGQADPSTLHPHPKLFTFFESQPVSRRPLSGETVQPPSDRWSTASSKKHDDLDHSDLSDADDSPLPAPFAPSSSTVVRGDSELHYSHRDDVEKQQPPAGDESEKEAGKDLNLIEWDGPDDSGNPQNWPSWKKWGITVVTGVMTFVITVASSIFSTATDVTAVEFGVSAEVMILGTSLFVLGFAVGPILWGPMSEVFGRKYPLFLGYFLFGVFQIPVAVAQNVETIMLCRFFGGFFASSPLAIVGGMLADLFNPVERGAAICIFAGATFIGPVAGPIIGGLITMSYLGWRWTAYVTAMMAFFFGAVGFLTVPETFAPVILSRRAKKIRYETKNWAVHAKIDENQIDLKLLAVKYLARPFAMLALEPILLLISLYMGLIYGILYLFFEAYPVAFQEVRGWNLGVGALPFISITVGVVLGCALIIYTTNTRFKRKMIETGHVVPEERLIPMIVGGIVLPAGLFWFGWTSSPNITWVPEVLAGIPIGMGVLLIFLQGLNYIIDVYKMNANSGISANAVFRSCLGAGFPLFANAMFHNLGVAWATSLLGFLTVALAPVPILFFIYGERLRKLSKYTPD